MSGEAVSKTETTDTKYDIPFLVASFVVLFSLLFLCIAILMASKIFDLEWGYVLVSYSVMSFVFVVFVSSLVSSRFLFLFSVVKTAVFTTRSIVAAVGIVIASVIAFLGSASIGYLYSVIPGTYNGTPSFVSGSRELGNNAEKVDPLDGKVIGAGEGCGGYFCGNYQFNVGDVFEGTKVIIRKPAIGYAIFSKDKNEINELNRLWNMGMRDEAIAFMSKSQISFLADKTKARVASFSWGEDVMEVILSNDMTQRGWVFSRNVNRESGKGMDRVDGSVLNLFLFLFRIFSLSNLFALAVLFSIIGVGFFSFNFVAGQADKLIDKRVTEIEKRLTSKIRR